MFAQRTYRIAKQSAAENPEKASRAVAIGRRAREVAACAGIAGW
jgi:hypothetical protein